MKPRRLHVLVGSEVLDIVTSGMYSKPSMVLREYVQNAVDSLDAARRKGRLSGAEGVIDIEIDGQSRSISVQDNGLGVKYKDLERSLGGIGFSTKDGTRQRGFRGIGRLGGLAYCDELIFETRASARDAVGVVRWDGRCMRKSVERRQSTTSLRDATRKAATVCARKASKGDPAHFLRVTMQGVYPFHKDELMNVERTREYISQVAPLPHNRKLFSFAEEVSNHIGCVPGYATCTVRVNGRCVERPYRDAFSLSKGREDRIRGVELFSLTDSQGRDIGRGWYAKTGFLASLPGRVCMRGIRVRQGNIEVGDEHFLEDLFAERRFATWHIGEVHVDFSVTPNARRDGFEQSVDYERVLEQLAVLGRGWSSLCRSSSKSRSSADAASRMLARVERQLKGGVFLDEAHMKAALETVAEALGDAESVIDGADGTMVRRLRGARRALANARCQPTYLRDCLDGRSLRYIESKELLVNLCRIIASNHTGVSSAQELIASLVEPYAKQGCIHRIRHLCP